MLSFSPLPSLMGLKNRIGIFHPLAMFLQLFSEQKKIPAPKIRWHTTAPDAGGGAGKNNVRSTAGCVYRAG
jgi:hypothetical protein